MCAAILFYETDKPYGCFSNFSRHPIVIGGVTWPTSEHYFQAAKFTKRTDVDAVRSAPTPFLAAQMGRERRRSFRNDWDSARDEVMREALHAKFTQHTDLLAILLSTHGAALVEHTRNDRYWAHGGDGSGLNMLGAPPTCAATAPSPTNRYQGAAASPARPGHTGW
ncbi:NADAR family protein [Pseudoduganella chitinolytica]|uniref:NADAR family protein n=1 Tax=Pseudoduganella chitinolytica TaxID=34070 RepID=A0ABY8BDF5_9BURK|nr:NADAR family protein [Pseudoduganella chitinolytica]WEF33944.1 NADAR family protein [Pseudoduganella chitinolytica]